MPGLKREEHHAKEEGDRGKLPRGLLHAPEIVLSDGIRGLTCLSSASLLDSLIASAVDINFGGGRRKETLSIAQQYCCYLLMRLVRDQEEEVRPVEDIIN